MEKPKYTFVFIVLTFRNTDDLECFFKANHVADSKVIVVNSFFDEESNSKFEEIAHRNGADFLKVPNNGYGAGNNRGVEYAMSHYDFDYLVISNADIEIEKFDKNAIKNNSDSIIAPKILTLKGKNQNPSSPFHPSRVITNLTYRLYKGNHRHLIWLAYIYSRLSKIIYYSISRFRKKIYSPHGAFFILPYHILKKMVPIYNEKMFLFYEETHIGKLAEKLRIRTNYTPEIVIRHKEDGSVSLLKEGQYKHMRDSYIELYNHWHL